MNNYQVDKPKLEYLIKSHDYTISGFCEKIGMQRSTFYKKSSPNYEAEFTVSEIQKIMDTLELDTPMGIFFTQKVS